MALPQTHSLAKRKQLRLESLTTEPLILHPRYEGPVLYDQILNLCRNVGFEPHIVHEEVKHQTRVGLVAAEIGVTLVPESVQQSGLPDVSYRSLIGLSLELQLAIARRQENMSPVRQGFLQIAQLSQPNQAHNDCSRSNAALLQ